MRLVLAPLLLLAACSSTPQPTCDGGFPLATATFNTFLGSVGACSVDAGCASVQNPCGLTDSCGFTESAVPAAQEAAAEGSASTLTAEDCTPACTADFEQDDFTLNPSVTINSGNACGEGLDADGARVPACLGGRCTLVFADAGD